MRKNDNRSFHLISEHGLTLVEVLVALAILGILSLGMASMMSGMATENRALSEKMQAVSLQQELLGKFKSMDFCSCFLQGKRFNVSRSDAKKNLGAIPKRFVGTCSARGNLLRVNRFYEDTSLKPTDIDIIELTRSVGDIYRGFLRVRFDSTELARAIKDVRIPIQLQLNMGQPAGRRRVLACSNGGTGDDPLEPIARGVARIPLQRGTYSRRITFPRSANFTSPPLVFLQSKWQYTSGSEDTAFWVTNVTTRSFLLNSHGPSGNEDQRGETGIYWMAFPQP